MIFDPIERDRWIYECRRRERFCICLTIRYGNFLHVNPWTLIAEFCKKTRTQKTTDTENQNPFDPVISIIGYSFRFERFTRPHGRNRYTLYRRGVGRTAENQITACSAEVKTPGAGQVPLQKWLTGIEQTAPPPSSFSTRYYYTHIYICLARPFYFLLVFFFFFSLSRTHTHTHTPSIKSKTDL